MTEEKTSHPPQDEEFTNSVASDTDTASYHLEVEQPYPESQSPELDDANAITYSRWVARYLSRFSWYFPLRPNRPSLEEAWHHYEHVTLPRSLQRSDVPLLSTQSQNDCLLAESTANVTTTTTTAERHSKLYPILGSPIQDLSNFGVSTRMYLSTLLVLAAILGLAGLGNIPLMIYYWGYANQEKEGVNYLGAPTIRSSAICDATMWVECESCNYPEFASYFPTYRLDGTNARKNTCNFEDFTSPGLWSFASTCLLLVFVAIASWMQRKAEVVFDEAVQTASDYSIRIRNPPSDALDPDEWRRFFNQYAVDGKGVVMVTVAIDNAELLKLLILRRQAIQTLSRNLPENFKINHQTLTSIICSTEKKPLLSYIGLATDVKDLATDILQYEDSIRGVIQYSSFKPSAVFVTFETERCQRNALHALSTGKLNVRRQQRDLSRHHENGVIRVYESMRSTSLSDIMEDHQKEHVIHLESTITEDGTFSSVLLFRNSYVLDVKEAMEPSDVRWLDLRSSNRLGLYIASTIGMFATCACCGLYIYRLVKQFPGPYATWFITLVSEIINHPKLLARGRATNFFLCDS
jgi:hypothetical protein